MNDISAIAQNFSLHDFKKVYEYIAEDVIWNNIGGEKITGKSAVVEACGGALKYFSTIKSDVIEVQALAGTDFVSVSTVTTYKDNEKVSKVASCDIYKFQDSKIYEITSYNIEL